MIWICSVCKGSVYLGSAGLGFRSQLIWIYTVCKGSVYPGSAGLGLSCHNSFFFVEQSEKILILIITFAEILMCCFYLQSPVAFETEDVHSDIRELEVSKFLVCLFDLGLTSLSAIFQSYRDGVWMWQGAQCSLLECCLTEISRPRHFDMIFHPVTLY